MSLTVLDIVQNGNFTDVLGAQILSNNSFVTWTDANFPDDWPKTSGSTTDGDNYVEEVPADSLHFVSSGANYLQLKQTGTTVIGKKYLARVVVSVATSGGFKLQSEGTIYGALSTVGTFNISFTADSTVLYLSRATSCDAVIDSIELYEVLSPWVNGADWVLNNTTAVWTSSANDKGAKLSQAIKLVQGAVYNVTFTSSDVTFANSDTYITLQLGGNTYAYQIREAKTITIPMPCGSTPSAGLEITAVNDTLGDTMTLDNISVKVLHFSPSTELGNVNVSMNGRVPAGAQILSNSNFSAWTADNPDGWTVSPEVGTAPASAGECLATESGGKLRMFNDVAGGSGKHWITLAQNVCTIGKEYLVKVDIASIASGSWTLQGAAVTSPSTTTGVTSLVFTAAGFTNIYLTTGYDTTSDITVNSIELYELADGPADNYVWDSATDYSSGAEALGIYNGQKVYKSASTHASGAGGADVYYYVRQQVNNGNWYITFTSPITADVPTGSRWNKGESILLGDYPGGSSTISTGTATVSYGNKDHSIPVLSGQQGIKTDGTSGYVDLITSWQYLNNLRAGKFAIVSCFNVDSETGDNERVVSAEISDGFGFHWFRKTVPSQLTYYFNGTARSYFDAIAVLENKIHNSMVTFSGTYSFLAVDGAYKASDDYSELHVCQSKAIRLGGRYYSTSSLSKASFGFIAILDLTSVADVNAAWSAGLSAAINSAARLYGYNPIKIAQAIRDYDSNIAGVYFKMNEGTIGSNTDSYYLLGYNISTDEAAPGFYGLTSVAGTDGILLSYGDVKKFEIIGSSIIRGN
jgi:hypothetical protein